jgi:hypothetical protein
MASLSEPERRDSGVRICPALGLLVAGSNAILARDLLEQQATSGTDCGTSWEQQATRRNFAALRKQ